MGREHLRTRQYIYLCFTGLVFFSSLGCANIKENEKKHAADEQFLRGQDLLARGDYEGSLRENQQIVSVFPKEPPGDKALFSMGLIYAHHNNPEKDYKKSVGFFTKLIEGYPQSALAEQARIWLNVLGKIEKEKQVVSEPEKKKTGWESQEQVVCKHLLHSQELLIKGDYQESLRENEKVLYLLDAKAPGGDKALFTMGLIYAHYGNPERDYKKSLGFFTKLVEDYPQSTLVEQAKIWVSILDIIEKEKQVDIEIEKKKKDLER